MSVSMRMSRGGSNKLAAYRIVVAPTRSKLDGAQLDTLGYYRPAAKPVEARIDLGKAREWLKKGAIPSSTVQRIIKLAEKKAAEGGADLAKVTVTFSSTKTKKTHKERLAAKKKKD
jgi:small subunit ribosomal protein S16